MQEAISLKEYAKQRKPFLVTHYPFLKEEQINAKVRQEWKRIESTKGLSWMKGCKGNTIKPASSSGTSLFFESSSTPISFNKGTLPETESQYSSENDSPYQKNSLKIKQLNQSLYIQGCRTEPYWTEGAEPGLEKNALSWRKCLNQNNRQTKNYSGRVFKVDYKVPEMAYDALSEDINQCSILKTSRNCTPTVKDVWKSKVRFSFPQSETMEQTESRTRKGRKQKEQRRNKSSWHHSVFKSEEEDLSSAPNSCVYEFHETDEPSCIKSYTSFKKERSPLQSYKDDNVFKNKYHKNGISSVVDGVSSICKVTKYSASKSKSKSKVKTALFDDDKPHFVKFVQSRKNSFTACTVPGKGKFDENVDEEPYEEPDEPYEEPDDPYEEPDDQSSSWRRRSKRLQGLTAGTDKSFESKTFKSMQKVLQTDRSDGWSNGSKAPSSHWVSSPKEITNIGICPVSPDVRKELFDVNHNNSRGGEDDFDDNESFYSDDENAALIVRQDQEKYDVTREERETVRQDQVKYDMTREGRETVRQDQVKYDMTREGRETVGASDPRSLSQNAFGIRSKTTGVERKENGLKDFKLQERKELHRWDDSNSDSLQQSSIRSSLNLNSYYGLQHSKKRNTTAEAVVGIMTEKVDAHNSRMIKRNSKLDAKIAKCRPTAIPGHTSEIKGGQSQREKMLTMEKYNHKVSATTARCKINSYRERNVTVSSGRKYVPFQWDGDDDDYGDDDSNDDGDDDDGDDSCQSEDDGQIAFGQGLNCSRRTHVSYEENSNEESSLADCLELNESSVEARSHDQSDIGSRGQDLSDIGSRGHDLSDIGSRGYDLSDIGSRGHDQSDIGSRGHDLSDIGSRGYDLSDIGSRGNDLSDIGSRGHGLSDIGSRGYNLSDIGSRGYDQSDIGSRGHDLSDIGSRGHDLSDIGSRGYDQSDIGSRGHDLSDIGSRGYDQSFMETRSPDQSDIEWRRCEQSFMKSRRYDKYAVETRSPDQSAVGSKGYDQSVMESRSYDETIIESRSHDQSDIEWRSYDKSTVEARSHDQSVIETWSDEESVIESGSEDEGLVSKLACETQQVLNNALKRIQSTDSPLNILSASSASKQIYRLSILDWSLSDASKESSNDESSAEDSMDVSRATNKVADQQANEICPVAVADPARRYQRSSRDVDQRSSRDVDQRSSRDVDGVTGWESSERFSLGDLFEDVSPTRTSTQAEAVVKQEAARRLLPSCDVQSCSNFGSLFDEETMFL